LGKLSIGQQILFTKFQKKIAKVAHGWAILKVVQAYMTLGAELVPGFFSVQLCTDCAVVNRSLCSCKSEVFLCLSAQKTEQESFQVLQMLPNRQS